MSRIFHHPAATGPNAEQPASDSVKGEGTPFDVRGALEALAKERGGPSFVDGDAASVLRLVDIEPTSEELQRLAAELGVQDGADRPALYQALMDKLKANGGQM